LTSARRVASLPPNFRPARETAIMRHAVRLATVLAVLAAGASSSLADGPFPDKNLETAVRALLRVDEKAELNDEALNKVFVLEAPEKGIANLTGLEKCKNLALLKLSKNQVVDLKPLAGLTNLQSLDLAGNQIEDVEPLKDLKALQYLELSGNKIAKIDALGGLTKLSALELSGNRVTDLAPLAELTGLASLHLAKNDVSDLNPLAKVNRLSTLDLSDTAVADLAPLKSQTDLKLLIIERAKLTDLKSLIEWVKTDADGPKRVAPFLRLYLEGNPLSDAAKTEQISTLKSLGVRVESGG
jgi:Leucine-rich repeat (LRR) protein